MKRLVFTRICTLLLLVIVAAEPASAQKVATAMSVKCGYYNLGTVKQADPGAANAEIMKNTAESQLRAFQDDANKKLQAALDQKKPKEEIEKLKNELQEGYNSRLQALQQLVQTLTFYANQNIAQAVNTVMKEKGLDMVIDNSTIMSGSDKLTANGIEVTEDVVKQLNLARSIGGTNSGAPAKPPAPAK